MDEVAFGRYRLLSLIGEGGMGKVFKAHDTEIGRNVAIKVLSTELSAEPGFRERFRREAHTAARLAEPHIIPIYDTGEIEGQLYLVMPVVDGVDVHGLLQRDGPMYPQRAVHVIEQLAAALDAAHAAGLVHRDVKPSNALVTGRDFVYLIDFGIAHHAAATKLTRTGTIVGSWAYMAPERFTSASADARADVYALACVLFECLTGEQPYPGDSLEQQFAGHYSLDPPVPSRINPTVPAAFGEVISRGMAKDPERRYQSANQLAVAARRALTASPDPDAAGQQTRYLAPPTPTPTRRPPAQPAPTAARPPPAPTASRPPAPAPGRPPAQTGPPKRARMKWPLIVTAVVLLAAAGIGGYQVLSPKPAPQASSPQSGPAPGQAAQTGSAPGPAGPQPSGPTVLPFTGLSGPAGVAVDNGGDVYVVDAGNGRVLEMAVGSSTAMPLQFSGLGSPSGVAVDAARGVYVTNTANNLVLKLAAGSSGTTQLPLTGLNHPHGAAVDSAEALYIADSGDNRVLKFPAGSTVPIVLTFTGLSNPSGVAVDSAGAVYVADGANNRVLKLEPGARSANALPFTGLNNPGGVAVDTAGAVYVADSGNNRIVKLAARSTSPTVLPSSGLNNPGGIAAASAIIYVADAGNNRVVMLPAG